MSRVVGVDVGKKKVFQKICIYTYINKSTWTYERFDHARNISFLM